MDAISYTVARANLAKIMDQVCNDHAPVIITRKREAPVVRDLCDDFLGRLSGDGRNDLFASLTCQYFIYWNLLQSLKNKNC